MCCSRLHSVCHFDKTAASNRIHHPLFSIVARQLQSWVLAMQLHFERICLAYIHSFHFAIGINLATKAICIVSRFKIKYPMNKMPVWIVSCRESIFFVHSKRNGCKAFHELISKVYITVALKPALVPIKIQNTRRFYN